MLVVEVVQVVVHVLLGVELEVVSSFFFLDDDVVVGVVLCVMLDVVLDVALGVVLGVVLGVLLLEDVLL